MTGRGRPDGSSGHSFDESTDWFRPVDDRPGTAVGVLDSPAHTAGGPVGFPPADHPSFPPGGFPLSALSVTPEDVLEVLGPDADELLASVNVEIDELIRMVNAETTVLPPIPPILVPDEDAEGRPAAELAADQPQGAPPAEVMAAVTSWKRKFVKAAIAAALVTLSGGGATALAMDKTVTVDVDGQQKTISTYESTVGEVLADEGIQVGAHDALSPSPQAAIGDGGKITLERGRQVTLKVDGVEQQVWTRAHTVGDALKQLNVQTQHAWVSADASAQIPLEGLSIEVKSVKAVTLFDGAGAPQQVDTTALTVRELLAEKGLSLGPEDAVDPGLDVKLVSGTEIHISRTGTMVINEPEKIEPPVQKVDDPDLPKGEQKVEDEGTPGEQIVTYRVTQRNGVETAREKLGVSVKTEAKPKIIRVGTKEPVKTTSAASAPAVGSGVWDQLARCEASGNWAANTGNGYYGGLQFDKRTWDAYGGGQYAAYPHQASREEQIAIATKVRDARGGSYSAWPACRAKLGLA